MEDLQELLYYEEEYKNTKSIESLQYLNDTMDAMLYYCDLVLKGKLKMELGHLLLRAKCKLFYGDRVEYTRVFGAIDREFSDLVNYCQYIKDKVNQLRVLDNYDALDLLYMLLLQCMNISTYLNNYYQLVTMLNEKNSGLGSGFLGSMFDEEAKNNKEMIEGLVKVIK